MTLSAPPDSQAVRIMIVFGTRPEVIKLAPVIRALESRREVFATVNVSTSQQRELTAAHVREEGIRVDHDLALMRAGQRPEDVLVRVVAGVGALIREIHPRYVLVQGDTTSALGAALAGARAGKLVAHVEAGLRTSCADSPYPEEANRRRIGRVADLHFAPTRVDADNLAKEGIPATRIFVTGNPGIDSLRGSVERIRDEECPAAFELEPGVSRILLATLHRRESHGQRLERYFRELASFVEGHDDVALVVPMHPNPQVRSAAATLRGRRRVHLLDPLPHREFLALLSRAWLVATDSGGVIEEAAALDRPLVILRHHNERAQAAGSDRNGFLVREPEELSAVLCTLHRSRNSKSPTSKRRDVFGDGHSAARIAETMRRDARLREIETWLLGPTVQATAASAEAGGIGGWHGPGERPRFVYGEITGYYLHWLAWLGGRSSKSRELLAPRARRAFSWIERRVRREALPLTYAFLNRRMTDWRNAVVFSFDLAMLLRGVEASVCFVEQERAAALARRLMDALALFCDDDGIAPLLLRTGSAPVRVPRRWSTERGAYQAKVAVTLLGARLAPANRAMRRSALLCLARARSELATCKPAGSSHPFLYAVEALIESSSLLPGSSDGEVAGAALRALLRELGADGSLRGEIGSPSAPARSDAIAQALRAGAALGIDRDEEGARSLELLAGCLLRLQVPGSGLRFQEQSGGALHLNTCASIFAHQALTLYGSLAGSDSRVGGLI